MLDKLNYFHGSNKNYVKPRSDLQASFGFNHFAGVVFYDARGNLNLFSGFSMNTNESFF